MYIFVEEKNETDQNYVAFLAPRVDRDSIYLVDQLTSIVVIGVNKSM